jgi:hypothetical protein
MAVGRALEALTGIPLFHNPSGTPEEVAGRIVRHFSL